MTPRRDSPPSQPPSQPATASPDAAGVRSAGLKRRAGRAGRLATQIAAGDTDGAAATTSQTGTASPMGRTAAKAAAGGVLAGRAALGDATAAKRLAVTAVKGAARSRTLRIATACAALVAFSLVAVMCGAAATGSASVAAAGQPPAAVSGPMWAAYRNAAGLHCTAGGDAVIEPEGRSAMTRPDMTLVVSVGRNESAHGRAVRLNREFGWVGPAVDAFGQFAVPIRSVPLYDPADFHAGLADDPLVSTVADHDGGRWDQNPFVDHAVGPTQTLPTFVATWGVDGNGDGRIDPHNAFDAVATTARFFCVQAARGRSRDDALMAYSNDSDYVDLVAGRYGETRSRWSELSPLPLPAGAPLAFDPTAGARWAAHLGAAAATDPMLVALVDAVGDPDADGGGIGLDAGDVACGTGGMCIWADPQVSRGTVDAWAPLAELGLGAPVLMWDRSSLVAAGALPATGFTIAWPVPSFASTPDTKLPAGSFPPAADSVALPMSITPWPPTPLAAPAWLDWHIPAGDPRWAALSGDGALHLAGAPAAAEVFAPVAGSRTDPAGGCMEVTGRKGWTWRLCGLSPTAATAVAGPGFTGQRLGHTTGSTVTITMREPAGLPACPQALTRRWSAAAVAPDGAFPYRSGADIAAEIVALWATADRLYASSLEPELSDDDRLGLRAGAAAADAAAEAHVVDLFESCQQSGYVSPFRLRRPPHSETVTALR